MDDPKKQSQMKSFGHAFAGIGCTVAGEGHMKFHVVIAVLALVMCAVLQIDSTGWCLVILCIFLVCSAEIFNTALEALADKVSLERDPLIKTAKDASAGAVLMLAIASVVVGLIVYIPAIMRFFE